MTTTADWLKIGDLLIGAIVSGKKAYDAHRAAAIAAGVPESAMVTSDQIFARDDPRPAGMPDDTAPSLLPHGGFAYGSWSGTEPTDDLLENQDHVYRRTVPASNAPFAHKFLVNRGGPFPVVGYAGAPQPSELIRIVSKA